jgi:hypothetical protein
VFDESRFPGKEGVLSPPTTFDSVSYIPFLALPSFTSPSLVQPPTAPSALPLAFQDPHSPLPSATLSSSQLDTSPSLRSNDPIIPLLPEALSASIPSHSMVTRPKISTLRSRSFPDYTSFFSTKHPLCALSSVSIPLEPTCYS